MKRAVATITVYVYGETVNDLKNEAKRHEAILLNDGDNRAEVEKLHLVEFGKIGEAKEIKL